MPDSNKIVKLSSVAEIRQGFTFREKVIEIDAGNAHIVQIKDIRQPEQVEWGMQLCPEILPKMDWQGKDQAKIVDDCVLLPCRGEYLKAHYLTVEERSKSALPIIASSQFLILTPKPTILTEYLCWYLNQTTVQQRLRQGGQGTKILMLSVASMNDFLIVVPSLDTQRQIVALNRLWEQEQVLTQKLLQNREQMMQGVFQQLLKE